MQKATHPRGPIPLQARQIVVGLFALTLLVLGTSTQVFAQDARVLQDRQNLENAAELAKAMHAANPTERSLEIMNQALDAFQQFEQANTRAIQQALQLEVPRGVQDTGGPDAFGYSYIDSNEPDGPSYNFIDLTGTGSVVVSGDDETSGALTLGGPGFSFYGTTYSQLAVSTNGYISGDLTDPGDDFSNDCPIPTPPGDGGPPRLLPLHDDFEGTVYHQYFGSCPHASVSGGCNVFHYNNMEHWPANGSEQFDFEAVLGDNGVILYQYAPGNVEQGSGSTSGVMNETSSIALQYGTCNSLGHITDNLAVLFAAGVDLEVDQELTVNEADRTGTYYITVANNGPLDATNVEVTHYPPPAMSVTGGTVGSGTYDSDTNVWSVGDLGVGNYAELWVNVSFDGEGLYMHGVEVTGSDQTDLDGSNDYDEVSVVVLGSRIIPDFVPEAGPGGTVNRGNRFSADLVLEKVVSDSAAAAGNDVTYTLSLYNQGPQSTANVEVTDLLPECLEFVSASADRGGYDDASGAWDVGKVKVGELLKLEIVATVSATCEGDVTNYAAVTASSLPDPDDAFNLFDDDPEQDEEDSATFTVEASGRTVQLDGQTFALGRNYPNPFNPVTMVPFSLAEAAQVSIKVYDLLGRTVATLVDGGLSAGVHEVRFEASRLPTGVYLVRMEAAGRAHTQRITLMK